MTRLTTPRLLIVVPVRCPCGKDQLCAIQRCNRTELGGDDCEFAGVLLFSFFVGINSKNVRYIFNYFFLHEKRGSTLGEGHVMLLLFGRKGTCCSCSCCRQSVDWWVRRRLRTAIRSNRLPNVHLFCVFDHLLLLVYLPQVSNQS